MATIFQKLLNTLTEQRSQERRAELYRNLIRREAKIGGELFGPIPKGHRREFFCLDEHTWVWHEEWLDANNQRRIKTTRYDVRPNGIIKVQDGRPSQYVTKEEARNLYHATTLYNQRIDAELADFL
jgi:hypothetical protein